LHDPTNVYLISYTYTQKNYNQLNKNDQKLKEIEYKSKNKHGKKGKTK
jgi:hypothetical protein